MPDALSTQDVAEVQEPCGLNGYNDSSQYRHVGKSLPLMPSRIIYPVMGDGHFLCCRLPSARRYDRSFKLGNPSSSSSTSVPSSNCI